MSGCFAQLKSWGTWWQQLRFAASCSLICSVQIRPCEKRVLSSPPCSNVDSLIDWFFLSAVWPFTVVVDVIVCEKGKNGTLLSPFCDNSDHNKLIVHLACWRSRCFHWWVGKFYPPPRCNCQLSPIPCLPSLFVLSFFPLQPSLLAIALDDGIATPIFCT